MVRSNEPLSIGPWTVPIAKTPLIFMRFEILNLELLRGIFDLSSFYYVESICFFWENLKKKGHCLIEVKRADFPIFR